MQLRKMIGESFRRTARVGRSRRRVATAVVLVAGLASTDAVVGQEPDERERELAEAWMAHAERVFDALELQRRHVDLIDYLVDDHLARDPARAEQRDSLVAVVREGVPWDPIHRRLLGAFVWAGVNGTRDMADSAVSAVVDEIVRWSSSPWGQTMLDFFFPPLDALRSDPAIQDSIQREFPEEIEAASELGAFLDTLPGWILQEFFVFMNNAWENTVRASRLILRNGAPLR